MALTSVRTSLLLIMWNPNCVLTISLTSPGSVNASAACSKSYTYVPSPVTGEVSTPPSSLLLVSSEYSFASSAKSSPAAILSLISFASVSAAASSLVIVASAPSASL